MYGKYINYTISNLNINFISLIIRAIILIPNKYLHNTGKCITFVIMEVVISRKKIQEQMNEVLSAMKPGQEVNIPIGQAGSWSNHISARVHVADTGRRFEVITRRSVCPSGKAIVRRLY